VLGLVPATEGTASVLGHDVASEGSTIRALVGYMPEHDCLPADVSASDLVVHMDQMSGLPYAAARERASDVLRHVGLAEQRALPPDGRLLHRHEAAREAGPGAGARPAAGLAHWEVRHSGR
jgi:ABC-2 type transport system ATP-binding protein